MLSEFVTQCAKAICQKTSWWDLALHFANKVLCEILKDSDVLTTRMDRLLFNFVTLKTPVPWPRSMRLKSTDGAASSWSASRQNLQWLCKDCCIFTKNKVSEHGNVNKCSTMTLAYNHLSKPHQFDGARKQTCLTTMFTKNYEVQNQVWHLQWQSATIIVTLNLTGDSGKPLHLTPLQLPSHQVALQHLYL